MRDTSFDIAGIGLSWIRRELLWADTPRLITLARAADGQTFVGYLGGRIATGQGVWLFAKVTPQDCARLERHDPSLTLRAVFENPMDGLIVRLVESADGPFLSGNAQNIASQDLYPKELPPAGDLAGVRAILASERMRDAVNGWLGDWHKAIAEPDAPSVRSVPKTFGITHEDFGAWLADPRQVPDRYLREVQLAAPTVDDGEVSAIARCLQSHPLGPMFNPAACGDLAWAIKVALDVHRRETGQVLVRRSPTRGLLISMAQRMDHAFCAPPQEIAGMSFPGLSPAQRSVVLADMARVHEEIVGDGFFAPEREAEYTAKLSPDMVEDWPLGEEDEAPEVETVPVIE